MIHWGSVSKANSNHESTMMWLNKSFSGVLLAPSTHVEWTETDDHGLSESPCSSSPHAHTHWTKPQQGGSGMWGSGGPGPQNRSALCFWAQLPTNPIPLPSASSQSTQSLLNYKEGVKQDPAQHNGVFLHEGPSQLQRRAVSLPRHRKDQRMCDNEQAEAECGKVVRSSHFHLRRTDKMTRSGELSKRS